MSDLVLGSEALNRVLDGRAMSRDDAHGAYRTATSDPQELFAVAGILRSRFKGGYVTFSKKAFLNVVNLCRDTCSYCTYKAEPGQAKASMMSRRQIADSLELAKRYGCVEALLVTGERPEQRYAEARRWLRENGFGSTAEYLVHASEMALEAGLFPHTNAGNLEYDEIKELQHTNVSVGVMLENSSPRLSEKGMPHQGAPSKVPGERIRVLENAGRLGIPTTTGVLVGIGETAEETIDSIFAIKELDERYGHIQEVILQNFQPKPDTAMRGSPPAGGAMFRTMVALARAILPRTNIQIPPNLSPQSYRDFLSAGINDWGGISPITPDYVNPEFPWPGIKGVERDTNGAGFGLRCRFPAYPEYFGLVKNDLVDRMSAMADGDGLVAEEHWR